MSIRHAADMTGMMTMATAVAARARTLVTAAKLTKTTTKTTR